jgi:hypothetical protein
MHFLLDQGEVNANMMPQSKEKLISVTRLGEFLPIGLLFTLCSFFENCKNRPNFELLFPTVYAMH